MTTGANGGRSLRRVALLLLLLPAAVAASPTPAGDPIVIVLSWDGVRHDYLDRADFPALKRIEREGLRADRLIPVFPSSTFPNHVSMVTGTYADRHGIVGNRFLDRERGLFDYSGDASWLDAEPIWAAAERQGVRTATFFWVGSETDWRGTGATHRRAPFDAEIGEAEKVDQIVRWLDWPGPERPRLILSWWHGADAIGHKKGPNHPGIVAQLFEQDAQLGRLLDAIDSREGWPHTTLLVVSDHGMTEATNAIDAGGILEAAGIDANVYPAAATATVHLREPSEAEAALRVLRAIPEVVAHRSDELPAAWRIRHPTRNGDLMLITTPPNYFGRPGPVKSAAVAAAAMFFDWKPGMHGYAPDLADMGAILLALGRGVPNGARIGPVANIQIAPTIAALLGIQPPAQSEAAPIPELLP